AQADEGPGGRLIFGGVYSLPIRLRVVQRGRRDLQHEELLRERLLQFLRRDAEAVDGEFQFFDGEARGARLARQGPAVGRRLGRDAGPLLDQQVRVHAAEAEAAYGRAARFERRPPTPPLRLL